MANQPFEFTSPAGYSLSGRLELAEGPARGWAIFAHCFTCGKDGLAASRVAQALARQGVSTLRFDFAGLGASGGQFADTSFAADVKDLIAAGEAMAQAGMAPALLVGHSLGGAAALAAGGQMETIRAVATIGAPADVAHVLHQFDPQHLIDIQTAGEAQVLLANRSFVVGKTFVEDAQSHHLEAKIAGLRRPLLVLHAPRDATVGIENANQIFQAAKHPKSFVALGEADHLLTRRPDAEYAAALIAAWASPYMAAPSTLAA
jgi:putative redox protein